MKDELGRILQSYMNSLYTPFQSNSELSEYIDKISSLATIISINRGCVMSGFIAFYENDEINKVGFITMLSVDDMMRNKGLGITLVEMCIQYLQRKGFSRMRLEVLKSNIPAFNLYNKTGFTTVTESNTIYTMERKL